MAPKERENTLALDTDTIPDRLGDRAFDIANMEPFSPTSVGPRGGSASPLRTASGTIGRQICIDPLPFRSDYRFLVQVISNETVDAGTNTTVIGLAEFAPKNVSELPLVPVGPDPGPIPWPPTTPLGALIFAWIT